MREKIKSLKLAFYILAVWGVGMTFLVPNWQIPDEKAHLQMIGDALGNSEIGDLLYKDAELHAGQIRYHAENSIDKKEWKAAMVKTPDYDREDVAPKKISPSVIKYLPASLGLMLGVGFHLPTFWVMELAELFSLAFYLLVCYQAVKIMPVKKEILFVIIALPMAVQQGSSISYDSVLLPLSFLLIACYMRLCYQEEPITWRHLLLPLLLLLLIAYIKMPYAMFGLLFFGLPFDRFALRLGKWTIDGAWIHKYRWQFRVFLILGMSGAIWLLRNNVYMAIVIAMCQEWKRTLFLMGSSVKTFAEYYAVSLVGCFGCLDSQLPLAFVAMIYIFMAALFLISWRNSKNQYPRKRMSVYLLLTFLVLGFFITISMVNHTVTVFLYGKERNIGMMDWRKVIYQIPYIGGLQGRYYIPFLALPFLALGKAGKQENAIAVNMAVTIYTLLAAVVTVVVLYGRYWT